VLRQVWFAQETARDSQKADGWVTAWEYQGQKAFRFVGQATDFCIMLERSRLPRHEKPREIPSKDGTAVPPGSARSLRVQPADRRFPGLQVNRQPGRKHTYLAQEIP